MAVGNLFPPPPTKYLPVSKGADLSFTVTYKPGGVEASWPVGCTVILEVDVVKGGEPFRQPYVPGGNAKCPIRVESGVTDTWKDGMLWRILLSKPDNPSLEIPVVNGEVKRFDGKMSR
ncbi:hypothetical protein SEA_JONJAMES_56 [Gordonia Phage JonJames]|nr:hypothetical protein SEA_JONJAMES_56 [Gordonia Phage JonJames]